jgi:D-amino-acid oxidase
MRKQNVLIIGSGVAGLTTALRLLQDGHAVTIWSKEPEGVHAHTWVPVRIDSDPRIERWTNESFDAFEQLALDAETGVAMRPIFVLKPERSESWYAGHRHARPDEIPTQYADAHVLDAAPVIDPPKYLTWLRAEVVTAGGVIEQRTVADLADVPSEFEVVINCAGLGARELANDPGVVPERVQVLTVKATGLDRVVIDDEGPNKRACAVPHGDYIKLGGVFDGANESLEVDDALTQDILDRCNRMVPGLNATLADVISVIRAIRPERSLPRVEQTTLPDGRRLVHNYGHDGMGYILSHGIADEIAGYLAQA